MNFGSYRRHSNQREVGLSLGIALVLFIAPDPGLAQAETSAPTTAANWQASLGHAGVDGSENLLHWFTLERAWDIRSWLDVTAGLSWFARWDTVVPRSPLISVPLAGRGRIVFHSPEHRRISAKVAAGLDLGIGLGASMGWFPIAELMPNIAAQVQMQLGRFLDARLLYRHTVLLDLFFAGEYTADWGGPLAGLVYQFGDRSSFGLLVGAYQYGDITAGVGPPNQRQSSGHRYWLPAIELQTTF